MKAGQAGKVKRHMDIMAQPQQWGQELQKAALSYPFSFSLLLCFCFLYLVNLYKASKLNLPPSPPKLPIIGNLHQLRKLPTRSMAALSQKYGPIMLLHMGSKPTVVISSAEVAQEITKNHDLAFSDRIQTTSGNYLLQKDVAFSPPNEYWRQMKKIFVTEILSMKRVQEFHYVREEETEKAMEKIRLSCLQGEVIDMTDLVTTVATDIISRIALGRSFSNEGGVKTSSGELVKQAIDLLGAVCFSDTIPMLGFLDHVTGFNAHMKRVRRELEDFLNQVIDEHEQASNDGDKSSRKDIVDLLIHFQKQEISEVEFTRVHLMCLLMDVFLGATDTSSTTLEWAMAELMKNPRIMKKAQEEVRKVVGKKSKIEDSDINEMTYLKCIIKEILRHRMAILIPRRTYTDVRLRGYDIPAETNVMINTYAFHRDPKVWERPDEFLPERFLGNPVDFKGQNSQYLPFGTGRRICPGINFAMKEVEWVLANFLYFFDWKLPNGDSAEDLDMSEHFTFINRKIVPLLAVPVLFSP